MPYDTFSKIGPSKTPSLIKTLLLTIIGISIGATLLAILFAPSYFFDPRWILSLSIAGIQKGLVFELITYAFIQSPVQYFDLSYLIHLAFNLYIFWLVGTQIIDRTSNKSFLTLLLTSVVVTGAFALILMALSPSSYQLSGNGTILYTLLISWLMLHPQARILLFFILPIQAKHLICGLLGANLLIDLASGDYIRCFASLIAAIYGYLFALIVWKSFSPFEFLNGLEMKLSHYFTLRRAPKEKKENTYHHTKIYDFKTGEPILDDDQFMDAMLSKISLYGEESLSAKDKKRMKDISSKKK